MAEWDGEGFEPGEVVERKGDAWEGEDEDDEVKDNWDDDDEEQEKDKPNEIESPAAPVVVKKKKSTVKKKILEKEEKMKEEMLRRAAMKEQEDEDSDDDEESILASKLAEKIKNQQLVEEADFEVTKDLFGGGNVDEASKTIDTFKPTNKDEFNELAKMIAKKLSQFETASEYPEFLEVLLRDLATAMGPEDLKKLANVLNGLASEKLKAQKAGKGKKKSKKTNLGGGAKAAKAVDVQDYSTYNDDCEDIM